MGKVAQNYRQYVRLLRIFSDQLKDLAIGGPSKKVPDVQIYNVFL